MSIFKRNFRFVIIALIGVMVLTVSCTKDDDDGDPITPVTPAATTANLTFKFKAMYIDSELSVDAWDAYVMLYDGSSSEIESKSITTGSAAFTGLEPGSYFIYYELAVETVAAYYYRIDYSETVRVAAGDNKIETVVAYCSMFK